MTDKIIAYTHLNNKLYAVVDKNGEVGLMEMEEELEYNEYWV